MSNIIFGTDGWRGLTSTEFIPENVALVAQAFADYLIGQSTNPAVAIGYDTRENSKQLAHLFAGILAANSVNTIISDKITPTPVISYQVKYKKLTAGVVITASHNPPAYNGVKFKSDTGGPFSTDQTQKVENLLNQNPVKKPSKNYSTIDFWDDYENHLIKLIDFDSIRKANLNIAIDSMGGAGGTYLQTILSKFQIPSETIFGTFSPDFNNRLAEPIEQNLKPLSDFLKSGQFAFGVATDGDADRLGVMDNFGNWMNIQETILYLSDYIINAKNCNCGIVKTSSVTDKITELHPNTPVYSVQVGFKYVSEDMLLHHAAFGAEESGGLGFIEHLPERDGIYSALVFTEMLAKSGHRYLSDFISDKRKQLGQIFYARIDKHENRESRILMPQKLIDIKISKIADFKTVRNEIHYNSRGVINSLKYYLEGTCRWLLIRTSETEPMIRIYAEGKSDDEVRDILNNGLQIIEANIY